MTITPFGIDRPANGHCKTDFSEGPGRTINMKTQTFWAFRSRNYSLLLPVVARMTLNGNASTYGYLNSFTGIGAIAVAIFLATVTPQLNLGKVLVIILAVLGLWLILLSRTHHLLFALMFATIAGFALMALSTIVNTLLQTMSSTAMKGRVISYFAMAYFGMQPLGSLLIGGISNYAGTPATILSQGIASLLIATLFFPYLWKDLQANNC